MPQAMMWEGRSTSSVCWPYLVLQVFTDHAGASGDRVREALRCHSDHHHILGVGANHRRHFGVQPRRPLALEYAPGAHPDHPYTHRCNRIRAIAGDRLQCCRHRRL